MTPQIGARVRVINRGPHDGKIAVVVSTNGYVVGVEIDDGVTVAVLPVRDQVAHETTMGG